MSGPQGSEPTRPWSPDPPSEADPHAETQQAGTPWWQNVPRRRRAAQPDYEAPRQAPPEPQPQPQPQYVQQPPAPVYAPPASSAVAQQKSSRWPLIIALLVGATLALVVVVAVVLILAGNANRKQLDVAKAEAGVRQILTDPTLGYGVDNVTDVKCNGGDNPTVKKGETFSCDVNVNGTKRRVAVLFIDDNGSYEVDRPR